MDGRSGLDSLQTIPVASSLNDVRDHGRSQKSTLRELRRAPCLVQTHLLAFHRSRITGHEPGTAQRRLQGFIVLDQRAGNTKADRTGLAGDAAAGDVDL